MTLHMYKIFCYWFQLYCPASRYPLWGWQLIHFNKPLIRKQSGVKNWEKNSKVNDDEFACSHVKLTSYLIDITITLLCYSYLLNANDQSKTNATFSLVVQRLNSIDKCYTHCTADYSSTESATCQEQVFNQWITKLANKWLPPPLEANSFVYQRAHTNQLQSSQRTR